MKQLAILNPENATDDEMLEFSVRESARAVVIDNDGNVALLHVAKKEYYKLPGGGIEGSEDKISSLLRECKEEIGCDVSVLGN